MYPLQGLETSLGMELRLKYPVSGLFIFAPVVWTAVYILLVMLFVLPVSPFASCFLFSFLFSRVTHVITSNFCKLLILLVF